MRSDYYGCRADLEQERIAEAEFERHQDRLCDPKHCRWCEEQRKEESNG